MTFKKLSYYLSDTKVTIKYDHAALHKFLTTHILNSKVNNLRIKIASITHATFEQIKEQYFSRQYLMPKVCIFICFLRLRKGRKEVLDIIFLKTCPQKYRYPCSRRKIVWM